MNADEIRDELAKRGISVIRRVVASDIATLNEYGHILKYIEKSGEHRFVTLPFFVLSVGVSL